MRWWSLSYKMTRWWTQKCLNSLMFDLEFRLCRIIKGDANLGGLRKIEYSSIKIKSKERHSSTSRAHWMAFSDFWCRKSRCKNSRPLEVMTHAKSDDAQSLILHGDCGCQKSRRESRVPMVWSPDPSQESWRLGIWLVCYMRASKGMTYVGSPDHRNWWHTSEMMMCRKWWRMLELPTLTNFTLTSDLAWTMFLVHVRSPEIYVRSPNVDLNG
jgi:hypothetical protein